MEDCIDLTASQPSPQPSPRPSRRAAGSAAGEAAARAARAARGAAGEGATRASRTLMPSSGANHVVDLLADDADEEGPQRKEEELEVVRVQTSAPSRPSGSAECEVEFLSADEARKITPSVRAQNRELKRKLEEMQRLQQRLQAHLPDVPPYWTVTDTTRVAVSRFDVPLDSPAALTLLEQWTSGGMQASQINRIERIENMPLWCKYWQRKREIERELTGGAPTLASGGNPGKEMYWFHGAAPSVLREIVSTGFDTRVANLTGMLGAGTYFASRASYSNDYSSRAAHNAEDMQRPPVPQYAGRKRGKGSAAAYAAAMAMAARAPPAHVGSERQMLLVRVVEGLAGTGVQGQRRPLRGCHSACAPDAAVGGVPQRLICIFDHTQAYPEYLISYTATR